MKILLILILSFLWRHVSSLFTPAPFINTIPDLLETGFIDALKSEPSLTAPLQWMNTFTQPLARIKLTGSQTCNVVLGIRGFSMYFAQNGGTRTNFKSSVSVPVLTSVTVTIDVLNQNYLIFYKLSYLAISSQFAGIFISQESFIMNAVVSSVYSITKTYTLPVLSTTPPSQYQIGISMHSLEVAYKEVASTQTTFILNVNDLGGGSLSLVLWVPNTKQPYIGVIQYYLVIVSNHIFNRWTQANIITRSTLVINYLNASQTDIKIEVYPTITHPKTSHNYFQMFRGFTTKQNYASFQFYITPDQKVYLNKDVRLYKIWSYAFFVYSNACPDPFYYDQAATSCKRCLAYCKKCTSEAICDQCFDNFTLTDTQDACICNFTVVAGLCFDFTTSPMSNCVFAILNQQRNFIECISCPSSLLMVAVNSLCKCKPLFEINPASQLCQEICGDGAVADHGCDDGNTNDGDGCSSLCKFEDGFKCTQTFPTVCWSSMELSFKVITIMKNKNNSAQIKLGLVINHQIPFNLTEKDFSSTSFTIKLIKSYLPFTIIQVAPSLFRIENNQIFISIDYDTTIEGLDSQITINMSPTQYPFSRPEIKIPMKGTNFPLVFSSNIQLFQNTSYGMMGSSLVLVALLLLGMMAGKFIGLEAAVTLQLIYLSQLLINPSYKIPNGFMMFQYLKFVNGYSKIIQITAYTPQTDIQRKFQYLQLEKTFLQNFNLSFVIVFLSFITFLIVSLVRSCKERKLIDYKQLPQTDEYEIIIQKQKFHVLVKISSLIYNITSQVSFWCILQFFSAIAPQIMISNVNSYFVAPSNILSLFHQLNGLFVLLSLLVISVIGLNSFGNIFLSYMTVVKLRERSMELNYKKALFIYLMLIGFVICFLNEIDIIKMVPMSLIALCIHFVYIGVLIWINPYKMSLRIHSVGLFTCQGIYGIFLIFINMINFMHEVYEFGVLVVAYIILCCSGFIILFTIVRLYYEYKFGEELQIKIQKERQLQEKRCLEQEQAELKRKIMQFENEAMRKISQGQQRRLKNTYLFENQLANQEQLQLLNWLENRLNWSEQKKEEYYFKRFKQKPLEWIKNSDKVQYERRLKEQRERRIKQEQKKDALKNNPQYDYEFHRLKKQFNKKYIK